MYKERSRISFFKHSSHIFLSFHVLQAPYLVYVEVLECDNVHTAPLPSKLLDTSVVQFARSEEDITRCSLPTERFVRDADPHLCLSVEVDEPDCWSQEDDDIIKVSETFVYWAP
jgi:hypothetical protein